MSYALVQNNNVIEIVDSLPDVWESISGFHHLSDTDIVPYGWFPYSAQVASLNEGEVLDTVVYSITPTTVVGLFNARPMTSDELATDLADAKTTKYNDIIQEYNSRMAVGFPWNFGSTDAPINETLQAASTNDLTNWLTLKDGCRDAVGAGYGNAPVSPPIRCTSNNQYTPTINQTLAILAALRNWGGAMLANTWNLKNQVQTATTKQQVQAIDVTVGWP